MKDFPVRFICAYGAALSLNISSLFEDSLVNGWDIVLSGKAADESRQSGGQTGQPGGTAVHQTTDTQPHEQRQQIQVGFNPSLSSNSNNIFV